MNNKALFRVSLSGFNKQDVVSYIEKISKDANGMLAEKDARITELQNQLQKGNEELENANERISQLEKEIAQKDSEISGLKDNNDGLCGKISALEQEVVELNKSKGEVSRADYDELKAKYTAVCVQADELRTRIEAYKELDVSRNDLGTILIKAEKNALAITDKAQKDAQEIVNKAVKTSEEIIRFRVDACKNISDTFDNSKADIDVAHRKLCENLEGMKQAMDVFYASLEESGKVVHGGLDAVKNIKVDCKSDGDIAE